MAVRSRPLRGEVRATIAVVVLAAAGVIALWPRGAAAPAGTPSAGSVQAGQSRTVQPAADDATLAGPRAKAALQPCPSTTGVTASGPLAGIAVPCLGAPGTVNLAGGLAGRPALLNVWASWCEPCRAELPALAEYERRPGAVPVVGVDVQDTPNAALDLLTTLGVRLPSVTDPDGALHAALQLPPALPVSYVVKADGSVTRIDPPTPFRTADEVAAALAPYQVAG